MKESRNIPEVPRCIVFSAPNIGGLKTRVSDAVKGIQNTKDHLSELALESGSNYASPLPLRCAVVWNEQENLLSKLEHLLEALSTGGDRLPRVRNGIFLEYRQAQPGKVAFMFPGFGAEYPGMMTGLLEAFPVAGKWLELLELFLGKKPAANLSLRERVGRLEEELATLEFGLSNGGPAGAVTSLFLYEIVRSLRVPCDMMVGHSNGDNTALISSGKLKYESPSKLIGILRQFDEPERKKNILPGAFYAVHNLNEDQLMQWIDAVGEGIHLGMDNCPSQKLVYITKPTLPKALNQLREFNGIGLPVPTEYPFHTPLYQQWIPANRRHIDALTFSPGSIPVYSCVDHQPFPDDDQGIREKFTRQWVEPVRFTGTLLQMYTDGARTFIDCGPNDRLAGFARDTFRSKDCRIISANTQKKGNIESIALLATQLWVAGYPVDLSAFLPEIPSRTGTGVAGKNPDILLKRPTPDPSGHAGIFHRNQSLMQAFLRSQISAYGSFVASVKSAGSSVGQITSAQKFPLRQWPFLSFATERSEGKITIQKRIRLADYPLLADHALGRVLPVIPFTLSMEIAAEAAAFLFDGSLKVCRITEAQSRAWLALDRDYIDLSISARILSQTADGQARVLATIDEINQQTGQRITAFEAKILLKPNYSNPEKAAIDPAGSPLPMKEDFEQYFNNKLFHGPMFLCVEKVTSCNVEGLTAILRNPGHQSCLREIQQPEFQIPGVMLDSTGQLMAYWLHQLTPETWPVFPYLAESFEQFAPFPGSGNAIYCKASITRRFSRLEGSFEFYSEQQTILGRLTGFQLRFFNTNWIDHIIRGDYRRIPLEGLTPELLRESGGIWERTLKKLKTNANSVLNH
ncbi:MAG TPA: polyketide synthase dehydratase domain-containing protein [Flavilitoribacter sp.]|nr:polyketide synthase dehydratase domain-containing protein [Flavilitoribacter sp.]HMQ87371.1 polyketide synthase dehydratase domain-containing protein [Flavilitoribacter sp.]